jgi:hypothetical protein
MSVHLISLSDDVSQTDRKMRELQHNHGSILIELFECWQVLQLIFKREDCES